MHDRGVYARVGRGARPLLAGPETFATGHLLVIDLEPRALATDLRKIPARLIDGARRVVIRCDDAAWKGGASANSVPDVLGDLARGVTIWRLRQPNGREAWLEGPNTPSRPDPRVVREIEFRALLEAGDAILKPKDYHFVLPNGSHAPTFVKVGRAIRCARDAEVLARWLQAAVPLRSPALVLCDTATVAALPMALSRVRNASRRWPVVILNTYPRTEQEVRSALDSHATPVPQFVLGILSVSASGGLRDRLVGAFESFVELNGGRWQLTVLVDQSGQPGPGEEPRPRGSVVPWYISPLEERARIFDRDCRHCESPEQARTVPIDPIFFEPTFPKHLAPRTPTIKARENARFWTVAANRGSVLLDAPPDESAKARRSGQMPVKIDWESLSVAPRLEEVVEALDRRLWNGAVWVDQRTVPDKGKSGDEHATLAEMHAWFKGVDAVLVPAEDVDRPGFQQLYGRLRARFDWPEAWIPIDGGSSSGAPHPALAKAETFAVFTLGLVSASALQRCLLAVQFSRSDDRYGHVAALVLHARPQGLRYIKTIRNSFASRFACVWFTPLPSRSALDLERTLLERAAAKDLSAENRDFCARRTAFLAGPIDVRSTLFYGALENDVLSPHSIFGDRLDQVTTFAAVGSAVEWTRHESVSAPDRIVFDMATAFGSYYDPLILASMLRWLRPYEPDWGNPRQSAESLLERVMHRYDADRKAARILIPELIVAMLAGVAPSTIAEFCREHAKQLLDDQRVPQESKPAIRFALEVLLEPRTV